LEGASRIQARAANLFSKDQLSWAGEIGNKFTKAFTEGDAAVARLKSIELGETVRARLVEAIEVRSESLGGLDGIIAGALTTVKGSGGQTSDQMKGVLTALQGRASSVTKEANETLISVLARRSEYRDVALLKVEQVMCDLESQFGEELSPQDIAAIARGEGGTAKLFEPIAKRAAKEIEKQLDAAEESVSDQTMLDVLKHVRKIVSGQLTLQAVLDDVVNILNDDNIVAAGENLMKQGEQVLDAIEGVSGNKVVDDVMQIAEKAGLTKDKVMEGIGKLDVNELLVSLFLRSSITNPRNVHIIHHHYRTMPEMLYLMKKPEPGSSQMPQTQPLILFLEYCHRCRFHHLMECAMVLCITFRIFQCKDSRSRRKIFLSRLRVCEQRRGPIPILPRIMNSQSVRVSQPLVKQHPLQKAPLAWIRVLWILTLQSTIWS
jgi:hypothetical protein